MSQRPLKRRNLADLARPKRKCCGKEDCDIRPKEFLPSGHFRLAKNRKIFIVKRRIFRSVVHPR